MLRTHRHVARAEERQPVKRSFQDSRLEMGVAGMQVERATREEVFRIRMPLKGRANSPLGWVGCVCKREREYHRRLQDCWLELKGE